MSILELLDSLLTRLVGSLDLQKEDITEEIGLHQAIIDSIGSGAPSFSRHTFHFSLMPPVSSFMLEMLLSKVSLSTVRNECLDFILKRLNSETKNIQTVPDFFFFLLFTIFNFLTHSLVLSRNSRTRNQSRGTLC